MTPLDAALSYARRGWRVLPIIAGQKRPPMERWQEVATTDENLIREWWRRWPDCGVGIATGPASGFFVLDVDNGPGKSGEDSLADLEATYGKLPPTVEVITGSGGRHLYFKWPEGVNIRNDQAGRLGPHLDIRGDGGQVVAPPTIHACGRPYMFEASSEPDWIDMAEPTDWFVGLLTAPVEGKARRSYGIPYDGPERPGDWFEAHTTWPELLEADGAIFLGDRIEHTSKTRYELWGRPAYPGEEGYEPHTSASLYYKGSDVLKVFTPNWRGVTANGEQWQLEQEQTYSRFAYWVARNHGGDFAAGARELAQKRKDVGEEPAKDEPSIDVDDLKPDPDVYALLAEPDPEYDWIIPQLLERHDRVIITGHEGGGKSTLLRQIGIQVSAGIHPFDLFDPEIQPARVMYVDLENSRGQIKRALAPMVQAAGSGLAHEMFFPICRPQGLDLRQSDEHDWLDLHMMMNEPDVLIIGPLYKMADGDPTTEEHAKAVSTSVDALRVKHDCAVIIEAHSPHGSQGSQRPLRPYGASLWLRWPEFGLGITPTGALVHWRGQRDERVWPSALERSEPWPWQPASKDRVTFARIMEAVETAGEPLSIRDISAIIGAGKSSVQRAIDANKVQFTELIESLR